MPILFGYLGLSWKLYILYTLLTTHITIAAVTIYLHRHQAHRALELHPVVAHFFRFWLWLTTGMETGAWAAIHRKHHARCETIEDPHSPQKLGLVQVLLAGAELYRREAQNADTIKRYGYGAPNDWLERHLYRPRSNYGIFVLLAINLLLFGLPGLTIWSIQMAWIPFFAAGVINGIGHYWGYRNFETQDAATNIVPWGILIGGEELHNNHHTYPTSAKLSCRVWEFDIGWLYISILQAFKLAKVKRVAPRVQIAKMQTADISNKEMSTDTVRDLIINRFQVMSEYTKLVILPILKQAKHNMPRSDRLSLGKLKNILRFNPALIDETSKAMLAKFLELNTALNLVYKFKLRLYEIWNQTTANQKELMDLLQKWCIEAEATGIKYLQEFSHYLKAYSLASSH